MASTRAPTSKLVHAAYVAKAAARMSAPEQTKALTKQLAAKFPGPPSPLHVVRLKRSPIGCDDKLRSTLKLLRLTTLQDVSIKFNSPRNNGMLFKIRSMVEVLPLRIVQIKREDVVHRAISSHIANQIPGYLGANGIFYLFEDENKAPAADLQPFITKLDGSPAFPEQLASFNKRCKTVQERNRVDIKDAVRLISNLTPQTVAAATELLAEGMVPTEVKRELSGTTAVHVVPNANGELGDTKKAVDLAGKKAPKASSRKTAKKAPKAPAEATPETAKAAPETTDGAPVADR
ncbi:hypothetical protein CAOG_07579 [Capsaspora owczarzaki ATCC 30864]|uniref:Large ribosomal subunit protein uL30-like ferredoxin-like fold domain-containing protein n=1 Tax=Capsaspora owczarzaki (strain ATCC 30864) TaxID=595528 RepID=A0A0D2X533_CAPO3|nr:hypothetical protein CAOG_07579 [Capsaspora owczarzaki ATCC 30864]KJE97109.1 hypothetical protein CAOG_007579 [Capsaspora owczarzaki ATCC 30864]|eukprot:XP_004343453.1 hypothetical protein CAOG_07579 [Capsaspora owczarzaki ATCC 30864]